LRRRAYRSVLFFHVPHIATDYVAEEGKEPENQNDESDVVASHVFSFLFSYQIHSVFVLQLKPLGPGIFIYPKTQHEKAPQPKLGTSR
jgi:hypothetical protein